MRKGMHSVGHVVCTEQKRWGWKHASGKSRGGIGRKGRGQLVDVVVEGKERKTYKGLVFYLHS